MEKSRVIRFEHPTLARYRARAQTAGLRRGGRTVPVVDGGSSEPLVSIAIAVKNGEKYLARAIDSALAQTYPHVEIVVADAASTDRSLDILRGYGDRIAWTSAPDTGPFDGMNRAVAASHGRFVKIHGHDDVLPPDSVATAVATFLALGVNADHCVVRSDMEIIDAEGNVFHRAGDSGGLTPPILHPTWYVPRAVYEAHGLYDPTSRASSDYEMYFYLCERGVRFVHAERPLVQFRTGGVSTSSLVGLTDGFVINRRYFGLAKAGYILAMAAPRTALRLGLERVVGTSQTTRARKWVKRALGESG